MLKNFIAFAVVLAATLAPAAPAAAWERVCMKLLLGKAWFAAENLTVLHGFDPDLGYPNSYLVDGVASGWVPESLGRSGNYNPAEGASISTSFAVNQSRCVDISGVEVGKPFMVYLTVDNGPARNCETHSSNPNWWYVQTERPYRTLWYEAQGSVWTPKCKFVYEN